MPDAITELVDLLSIRYESADSIKGEDVLIIGTSELAEKIRNVYPAAFTDEDLYTAMRTAGFTPKLLPGGDFTWLLLER